MNENETFENFVVGRLFGTEAVYFELPTTQEDSSNLEELNKKDVYSILERFNYELGSECQYIESLLLGETGLFHNSLMLTKMVEQTMRSN